MFKTFGKTLLAVTLAGAVAGVAQAEEKVLHVYNWSDYIAPDTVEKFTKALQDLKYTDKFGNPTQSLASGNHAQPQRLLYSEGAGQ